MINLINKFYLHKPNSHFDYLLIGAATVSSKYYSYLLSASLVGVYVGKKWWESRSVQKFETGPDASKKDLIELLPNKQTSKKGPVTDPVPSVKRSHAPDFSLAKPSTFSKKNLTVDTSPSKPAIPTSRKEPVGKTSPMDSSPLRSASPSSEEETTSSFGKTSPMDSSPLRSASPSSDEEQSPSLATTSPMDTSSSRPATPSSDEEQSPASGTTSPMDLPSSRPEVPSSGSHSPASSSSIQGPIATIPFLPPIPRFILPISSEMEQNLAGLRGDNHKITERHLAEAMRKAKNWITKKGVPPTFDGKFVKIFKVLNNKDKCVKFMKIVIIDHSENQDYSELMVLTAFYMTEAEVQKSLNIHPLSWIKYANEMAAVGGRKKVIHEDPPRGKPSSL